MAVERSGPYIWVTWLTKLMAAESHCEWASWFRAHYQWDKLPGDFDLAKWTTEHNALVHERSKQLEAEGLTVYTEDQNAFRVEGKTGIVVAGKADIVAITEEAAFVEDCKTGDPRNSDHMQVMIYLLTLPLVVDHCKGRNLEGRIIYKDSTVDVPSSKVNDELKQLFRKTVLKVGSQAPPKKAPSWGECHFCDISKADCPQRVDVEPTATAEDHNLFRSATGVDAYEDNSLHEAVMDSGKRGQTTGRRSELSLFTIFFKRLLGPHFVYLGTNVKKRDWIARFACVGMPQKRARSSNVKSFGESLVLDRKVSVQL